MDIVPMATPSRRQGHLCEDVSEGSWRAKSGVDEQEGDLQGIPNVKSLWCKAQGYT